MVSGISGDGKQDYIISHGLMWCRETLALQFITGQKIKFLICPVDMKSDISLTILYQSYRG